MKGQLSLAGSARNGMAASAIKEAAEAIMQVVSSLSTPPLTTAFQVA